jgi:hypothetical protein
MDGPATGFVLDGLATELVMDGPARGFVVDGVAKRSKYTPAQQAVFS